MKRVCGVFLINFLLLDQRLGPVIQQGGKPVAKGFEIFLQMPDLF